MRKCSCHHLVPFRARGTSVQAMEQPDFARLQICSTPLCSGEGSHSNSSADLSEPLVTTPDTFCRCRCGLLMAARALKTRQVTGICITASHNPAPDNGVKLVEPSGEMLSQEWEVSSCGSPRPTMLNVLYTCTMRPDTGRLICHHRSPMPMSWPTPSHMRSW